MSSFNQVILLGNLTRDPEVRYTPNGKAVASFAIAVNEKYKVGEEVKENVSYIDIVVWGKSAENCGHYLGKGDSVLIDGKLSQRRWDDKDSGAKRSKLEVVAKTVTFIKTKGSASGQNHSEPAPEAPVEESEIPF